MDTKEYSNPFLSFLSSDIDRVGAMWFSVALSTKNWNYSFISCESPGKLLFSYNPIHHNVSVTTLPAIAINSSRPNRARGRRDATHCKDNSIIPVKAPNKMHKWFRNRSYILVPVFQIEIM